MLNLILTIPFYHKHKYIYYWLSGYMIYILIRIITVNICKRNVDNKHKSQSKQFKQAIKRPLPQDNDHGNSLLKTGPCQNYNAYNLQQIKYFFYNFFSFKILIQISDYWFYFLTWSNI